MLVTIGEQMSNRSSGLAQLGGYADIADIASGVSRMTRLGSDPNDNMITIHFNNYAEWDNRE